MFSQQLIAVMMASVLLLPACARAQADAGNSTKRLAPHELYGFLLRQSRASIEDDLGKPFHQLKNESGQVFYAYHLRHELSKDYLVVCYGKNDAAIEMELTGSEPIPDTGFLRLGLGDSSGEVEKKLGKPSKIRHEDDADLDLWDYKDRNYTLEFTADHTLYSIQIIDETEHSPDGVPDSADLRLFANTIRNHDVSRLIEMVSGEVECSEKEAYGIRDGAARRVLANASSKISVCLNRAANAILALGPETKGAEGSLRIWTEAKTLGYVIKFPKTSSLREIVWVGEADGWRVYEVTFR